MLLKFFKYTVCSNMVSPEQFVKANHFESVLRPYHERSVPNPAVIVCQNRVLFMC